MPSRPGSPMPASASAFSTTGTITSRWRREASSGTTPPYGGVVPELAARRHLEAIVPVVEKALADAGIGLPGLDGIAVTQGPGLVGSLLVGCSLAKALAYAHGKPFVGVNHLEGHIYAAFLTDDPRSE